MPDVIWWWIFDEHLIAKWIRAWIAKESHRVQWEIRALQRAGLWFNKETVCMQKI